VPAKLASFVRDNRIQVLNVAGSRGSKLTPERLEGYREQFREGLQLIMRLIRLRSAPLNATIPGEFSPTHD
jgi:hypothetical protein